jgi:hypothetical protein
MYILFWRSFKTHARFVCAVVVVVTAAGSCVQCGSSVAVWQSLESGVDVDVEVDVDRSLWC